VIRLSSAYDTLTPAERYGLDLLIDLARLVPVADAAADVVRIEVVDGHGGQADLPTCLRRGWDLGRGDGVVRLPRTTLRWMTDLAGAGAEHRATARDGHGRVPSSENALVAHGVEQTPVVSQAGVALRNAVLNAAGRRIARLVAPWPDGRRWAAAFTHDLDVVAGWPLFTLLRLRELIAKAEIGRSARVLGAAAGALGRAPVWHGVRSLLETEQACGIRSTWFVLCGTPTLGTIRAGDLTYRPQSPAARRIFAELARRGCEIGLHGSFATAEDGGVFAEQRRRLRELVGDDVPGVRQHFLRLRHGATARSMAAAGFRYDTTYGFPDRNGFRLGVADVLPAWDAERLQPLSLEEAPLCWMDRALSKYRGVEEPQTWVRDGLALAQACRAVEGVWVGVWHPNLTPALGFPDAPAAFADLARRIVEDGPFVAPLATIVDWRVLRRSVRVRRLAPDGRLDADATGQGAIAPILEDAAGRSLERVTRRG